MNRMRHSRGFTLIEVLTTVTIMAGVFLGFIVLLYDMAEQMHISWQLRDAEEYGAWYVKKFNDHVRNGTEPNLTRVTAPSELEVTFIPPSEFSSPPGMRVKELWEFEYSYQTGLPQIRIDDQILDYEYFPPLEPHKRDEYWVDPESFLITKYNQLDLPQDQQDFRDAYYSIYFEITYRRQSSIPGRGTYSRVIPVTGAAYVINENWPDIKPPAGLEEDG